MVFEYNEFLTILKEDHAESFTLLIGLLKYPYFLHQSFFSILVSEQYFKGDKTTSDKGSLMSMKNVFYGRVWKNESL
jgi:hypothetical protein